MEFMNWFLENKGTIIAISEPFAWLWLIPMFFYQYLNQNKTQFLIHTGISGVLGYPPHFMVLGFEIYKSGFSIQTVWDGMQELGSKPFTVIWHQIGHELAKPATMIWEDTTCKVCIVLLVFAFTFGHKFVDMLNNWLKKLVERVAWLKRIKDHYEQKKSISFS